ncbi:MAG: SGNH/GDSL hydrolase family protein [Bdellovibrionota bacterium]
MAALLSGQAQAGEKRILFLGDSQSYGMFGEELDRLMRHQGLDVESYARGGATPDWYTLGKKQPEPWGAVDRGRSGSVESTPQKKTPRLEDLLKANPPDHLIVELSDNLARSGWTLKKIEKVTEEFLKEFRKYSPQAKCTWVGSFNAAKKPALLGPVLDIISDLATKYNCRFIDSRPLVTYPAQGGDQFHLDTVGEAGRKEARSWAFKIRELVFPVQAERGKGSTTICRECKGH